MGFEEPEVLVQFTRDAGKEIGGDFVAEIVTLIDGLAKGVGMVGNVVDEPFELGSSVGGGQVCFLETALGGGFANGAVSHTTERYNALSDGVGLNFEMCGNGIE